MESIFNLGYLPSNKVSWQYVAGLFDGEGTVCIHGNSTPQAKIAQSGFDGVAMLREIRLFLARLGIHTTLGYRQPEWIPKAAKPAFIMHVVNRKSTVAFLRGMLPHLILKRGLVEDILRFEKFFPKRNRWDKYKWFDEGRSKMRFHGK